MGAVKAAYLAAFDVPVPPASASDIGDGLEAMVVGVLPPKTLIMSEVTAADIANAAKFVVGGGTAGLGVGDYEGWAICNGNNGTRALGKFLRGAPAGVGAGGGSDSSAHTHPLSDAGGAKISAWGTTLKWAVEGGPNFTYVDIGTFTASAGSGTVASNGLIGNTDAASATDNKPAYDDIVYLMKL